MYKWNPPHYHPINRRRFFSHCTTFPRDIKWIIESRELHISLEGHRDHRDFWPGFASRNLVLETEPVVQDLFFYTQPVFTQTASILICRYFLNTWITSQKSYLMDTSQPKILQFFFTFFSPRNSSKNVTDVYFSLFINLCGLENRMVQVLTKIQHFCRTIPNVGNKCNCSRPILRWHFS